MSFEKVSEAKCFGGRQLVFSHRSSSTGTDMRFAVFVPPEDKADRAPDAKGRFPVLWFLSGLTCTEQNVITKSGFQRRAAERGLVVVCPDTSPRGTELAGEHDDWDFGSGAGFYLDARKDPYSAHYNMESYVVSELPSLVFSDELSRALGVKLHEDRQGICGHSMGGHGALTLALRHPGRFSSLSAFAPICHPREVPWGKKAFAGYLGDDEEVWKAHDACDLLDAGKKCPPILVDQGEDDAFLSEQLMPKALQAACARNKVELELRMQPGYDHSYFFIATFIADHIDHHAGALRG